MKSFDISVVCMYPGYLVLLNSQFLPTYFYSSSLETRDTDPKHLIPFQIQNIKHPNISFTRLFIKHVHITAVVFPVANLVLGSVSFS